MSTGFELAAQVRDTHGKAAARRMRQTGVIPGVIYGGGKAPQSITLPHDAVLHALQEEAFHSHILDIKLDNGQAEKVVLKEVQRHAYKMKVEHVDFMRVSATEKLTMKVPLHFIGEDTAPGLEEGGVVSKLMTDLEIKCLPAQLPEFIEVDMSGLHIDQALHLSDIKLPAGVELAHGAVDEAHDHPVVSIHKPKVSAEAEEVAEVEAAADEAEDTSADAAEGDADAEAPKDA